MIPGVVCGLRTCPILVASYYSLIPNLDIIGKVPSDTSILIQQGKNDSNTPMEQAFLLQQELTEVRHPDHTLITYPDLGHEFSPSSPGFDTMDQWIKRFWEIFLAGLRTQSETLRNLQF